MEGLSTPAQLYFKNRVSEDFPGGPVGKTSYFQCRGLGSVSGQGTRPHMPQPRVHMPPQRTKIPRAKSMGLPGGSDGKDETKTQCKQINKHSFLKKEALWSTEEGAGVLTTVVPTPTLHTHPHTISVPDATFTTAGSLSAVNSEVAPNQPGKFVPGDTDDIPSQCPAAQGGLKGTPPLSLHRQASPLPINPHIRHLGGRGNTLSGKASVNR